MTSARFKLSIDTLKKYTMTMINRCEVALKNSIEALINRDYELANQVVNEDYEIDILKEYVCARAVELMTSHINSDTKDLRYVYALCGIAIELEIIGDYAANIATEFIKMGKEAYVKELVDIPKMSELCLKMISDTKKALQENDEKLAYEISFLDEEISTLYEYIHKDCTNMMNMDNTTINQGVRFLFIGRYLNKIGEHTINVCEKIIYAIKSDIIETE
jgi:phosphate transport system protein